jgi:hypothetical protein
MRGGRCGGGSAREAAFKPLKPDRPLQIHPAKGRARVGGGFLEIFRLVFQLPSDFGTPSAFYPLNESQSQTSEERSESGEAAEETVFTGNFRSFSFGSQHEHHLAS